MFAYVCICLCKFRIGNSSLQICEMQGRQLIAKTRDNDMSNMTGSTNLVILS